MQSSDSPISIMHSNNLDRPPHLPSCPAWPLPYGRYVVFRLLGTRHVSAAQLRLQVLVDPWAMCARRELQLCVLAG